MERDAKVSDESLQVSSLDLGGGGLKRRRTGCPSIHPWECVLSEDCVWTPAVSVGMRKQQCQADELVTRKNEELAVTLHLSTELAVQASSMSYDSQPLQCSTVLQPKPAETRVWLNRCGSFKQQWDSCLDTRLRVCTRHTTHDDLPWLHSEHAVTSSLYMHLKLNCSHISVCIINDPRCRIYCTMSLFQKNGTATQSIDAKEH